ncbi:double Clp-N motif-containing P-loop nucleosidetriphosphate hydrolases superfamily protein [Striga asiatica]|uniref:Double Clp-N motif-containing P-loop nucleosidetriphosphate hydrolases superfamily protein n=1 Tax=Striga asiatica TaxID=4170 RepID=A0A5A7Q418_STRAF|nr:double Clp-N motif-containing P-loop nucleosidetriphosphate hydrolases superfamily protein [Striga asiatica]
MKWRQLSSADLVKCRYLSSLKAAPMALEKDLPPATSTTFRDKLQNHRRRRLRGPSVNGIPATAMKSGVGHPPMIHCTHTYTFFGASRSSPPPTPTPPSSPTSSSHGSTIHRRRRRPSPCLLQRHRRRGDRFTFRYSRPRRAAEISLFPPRQTHIDDPVAPHRTESDDAQPFIGS